MKKISFSKENNNFLRRTHLTCPSVTTSPELSSIVELIAKVMWTAGGSPQWRERICRGDTTADSGEGCDIFNTNYILHRHPFHVVNSRPNLSSLFHNWECHSGWFFFASTTSTFQWSKINQLFYWILIWFENLFEIFYHLFLHVNATNSSRYACLPEPQQEYFVLLRHCVSDEDCGQCSRMGSACG